MTWSGLLNEDLEQTGDIIISIDIRDVPTTKTTNPCLQIKILPSFKQGTNWSLSRKIKAEALKDDYTWERISFYYHTKRNPGPENCAQRNTKS